MSALQVTTELGFEVETSVEERGIYTAARLRHRKPEIAAACEKMLQSCVSTKTIASLLGLDIRTVGAMAEELQASGSITPYKERTLAQLRSVITLGLDGLMDRAAAGKIQPIEWCALVDKHELLSGGATARVEIVQVEADDFLRLVTQERTKMARGIVIEERGELQKGAGADRVALLADGGEQEAESGRNAYTGDTESRGEQAERGHGGGTR